MKENKFFPRKTRFGNRIEDIFYTPSKSSEDLKKYIIGKTQSEINSNFGKNFTSSNKQSLVGSFPSENPSSKSAQFLSENNKSKPLPISKLSAKTDTLKAKSLYERGQMYDLDTWRMYNRIVSARELVNLPPDQNIRVARRLSQSAPDPIHEIDGVYSNRNVENDESSSTSEYKVGIFDFDNLQKDIQDLTLDKDEISKSQNEDDEDENCIFDLEI